MFFVLKVLIFVAVVVAGYEAVTLAGLLRSGAEVSREAARFERANPNASMRILVAGDSTAVGTGAHDPKDSIAGRVGTLFADAHIENIGVNGLKTSGLREKLAQLPEEETYDLVLLQIGGNDILRFTPRPTLRRELSGALEEAKKRGRRVILMSTGNVGLAPAFPFFLSHMYSYRTRAVRTTLTEEAAQAGVTYVDLFEERETDPFGKDPDTFYSRDGLHPSGAGYGLWFKKLEPELSR